MYCLRAFKTATVRSVRKLKADNNRVLGLKFNIENWEAVFETFKVNDTVNAFNNVVIEALDTCVL